MTRKGISDFVSMFNKIASLSGSSKRITKHSKKPKITPVSLFFILSAVLLSVFGYSLQNTDILGEYTRTQPAFEENEYLVTKVVDGDTLKVLGADGEFTVRLIGIDAPETKSPKEDIQCYGPEASDYLTQLVANEKVLLIPDSSQADIDRYGRILRYAYLLDGSNIFINEKLIEDGYAFEYTYDDPYLFRDDFIEAEDQARSAGLGLWNVNNCDYLLNPK